jgi:hypothetical protein
VQIQRTEDKQQAGTDKSKFKRDAERDGHFNLSGKCSPVIPELLLAGD